MVLQKGKTLVLKKGEGAPPYRKLTLGEAFDIATIPNALGSSMQAEAARRISVRFAEAAALPCVQNTRGAFINILSLMLGLIRFRRVGGPAWEVQIDSERVPNTGKQRFGRRQ